jgi:hypothetical protein
MGEEFVVRSQRPGRISASEKTHRSWHAGNINKPRSV